MPLNPSVKLDFARLPDFEVNRMDEKIFKKFCAIAYEKAGINLKEGKEALVSARVSKRMRTLKIEDIREYMHFLENDESGTELVHFLDAISTNFTHFYREKDHFEYLETKIKEWLSSGQKRFRIWSAASSSGEEPYSIIMTMLDLLEGQSCDFKLLATDISTKILSRAINGIYETERIEPVPKAQRNKYMLKLKSDSEEDGVIYQMNDQAKKNVVFKRLNLSQPPFPMKGPMDVIFCRNVMIYFDREVRQRLVSEMERLLKPGGILMIGHTETLAGIQSGLKIVSPSIYRKN